MAKKDTGTAGRRIVTPRFLLRVALAATVLLAALYAWHKTEQFLIRDARFAVAIPDYGLESPSFQITGLRHASRVQVLHVFSPDYGRSLYLLPLRERREQLQAIDWIRSASVARVWPNRVMVQVEEREPVAFVNVPAERAGFSRVALIDNDGVIMQLPQQAHFNLPVALGINPGESVFDRRARVHRLTTLMREVGDLSDRISEVNVADPDNLRVTARAGNRTVALLMGDHNFSKRFRNFTNNFGKISERLADATVLDVRLEDRITVVEARSEPGSGNK